MGGCTYLYLLPFKYTFTLGLGRLVSAFITPSMDGRCGWKRRYWEGAVLDFCQQEQISTFALQSFPVSSFHLFHFLSLSLLFPLCSSLTDYSTIASPSLVNYSPYPQQQAFHIISLNQKKTYLFLGILPASRFPPRSLARSLAHPPRPGLSSYNTFVVYEQDNNNNDGEPRS